MRHHIWLWREFRAAHGPRSLLWLAGLNLCSVAVGYAAHHARPLVGLWLVIWTIVAGRYLRKRN